MHGGKVVKSSLRFSAFFAPLRLISQVSGMKSSDNYHKWVKWSEEDQVYIGKCPDLISGIHGDDPVQLYKDLCEVVEDVIHHFGTEKRSLPVPRVRPMS